MQPGGSFVNAASPMSSYNRIITNSHATMFINEAGVKNIAQIPGSGMNTVGTSGLGGANTLVASTRLFSPQGVFNRTNQ